VIAYTHLFVKQLASSPSVWLAAMLPTMSVQI